MFAGNYQPPRQLSNLYIYIYIFDIINKCHREVGTLVSLGPRSPRCQLLKMMLQDGGLLELSGKAVKDPSGMEVVTRDKELELSRDVDFGCALEEEDFNSHPNGFVKFTNCLGMPVAGFEKKICALVRKMESRKGRDVRVTRSKKRSSSRFKREIRKLEYSVNYNSSLFIARGRGSGAGV